jgi:Pentapeptide repeats (8 copies)
MRTIDELKAARDKAINAVSIVYWDCTADKLLLMYESGERDFRWVRMPSGANLEGANLYRANLEGANLEGANLEGANLEGANLYRANLEGANLEGANLEGAKLERANLERANLERANGIKAFQNFGSRGDTLYAVDHEECLMVKAGCFWGTLEVFIDRVAKGKTTSSAVEEYQLVVIPALQGLQSLWNSKRAR